MSRKAILRTGAVAVVIVAVGVTYYFLPLKSWGITALVWIRGLGSAGIAIYGAVYSLAVLALPASLLTAAAGLIYGPVVGVLIVSPASVVGAALAFVIARYLARSRLESRIVSHPKFAAIQRAVEKNGFKFVVLLRLQPIVPFMFLNYALGLTRVRLRDYVLASWIGMLPGTILYVYLGSALRNVDDLFRPGALQHGGWAQFLFWLGLAAAAVLSVWAGRLGRAALRQELELQPEPEKRLA